MLVMPGIDLATDSTLALAALAVALLLRPWRALPAGGPPWPWVAWCAVLPALWGADRLVAIPMAQPLAGACLLVLMCGWPLAVLALLPVALLTQLLAGLEAAAALHRLVWFGFVPATLALGLGALVRRWLPRHLMVYILGRGFLATAAADALAGAASALLHAVPAGLSAGDLMIARLLAAFGDAWICGMLVAIFVAFRPQWLATYTDRLYLPIRPHP
jgi:uncharacterized membrane protein